MSSASDAAPRTAFIVSLLTALLFAISVYWVQNAFIPVGGAIAIEKSFWLATALFAWFVLPPILAADRRLPTTIRRGYLLFWIFMLMRGIVELLMMYVWRNWLPTYGIAQDIAAMLLLAWLFVQNRPASKNGSLPVRAATWNWVAIGLLFVPEICFASYMLANFQTRGDDAIYFVPDDPQFKLVLRASAFAVIAFSVYLAAFARAWLRKE